MRLLGFQRTTVAAALVLVTTSVATAGGARRAGPRPAPPTRNVRALPPPRSVAPRLASRARLAPLVTRKLVPRLSRVQVLAVDLDNTLVDTRPRTLAAVHRFAREARLSAADRARLSSTRLHEVGWDGAETARKLAIPKSQRAAFRQMWLETFWAPASMALDRPIPEIVALVHAARRQGVEVVFLTGRRDDASPGDGAVRRASEAQLERLGVARAGRLLTKPATAKTPAFKRQVLDNLARNRRVLYLDDSAANVRESVKLRSVDSVLVDFAVREPGWIAPKSAEILQLRPDRN